MEKIIKYITDNPGITQQGVCDFIDNQGVNKTRRMIEALNDNGYVSIKKIGNRNAHYVTSKEFNRLDFALETDMPKIPINKNSFIYGIQIEGERPIKIGITTNLKKRIEMMQTSNFRRYIVSLAVLVKDAAEVEKNIHKQFENKRLAGEWFDITIEELKSSIMAEAQG